MCTVVHIENFFVWQQKGDDWKPGPLPGCSFFPGLDVVFSREGALEAGPWVAHKGHLTFRTT